MIEKIDDKTFKRVETKEVEYNIDNLLEEKKFISDQIDNLKINLQELENKVSKVDILITEAKKQGIRTDKED